MKTKTAKPAKSTAKKAAKPKKTPMSAGKKAGLLAEKIQEMRDVRRAFNVSFIQWQEAHAHAAELKKTAEKNQAKLNGICADIDAIQSGNYTPSLPFKDDKPSKGKKGKAETNGHATPESWRGVSLTELGLSEKIIGCLSYAKIETMGALADWSKRNRITDVKGIGEAAAETIEEATTKYWREHPPADAAPEAPANGEAAPTIFEGPQVTNSEEANGKDA